MTKPAKKNVKLTPVEQWFCTVVAETDVHAECGHDAKAHQVIDSTAPGGTRIECPATPPAKAEKFDLAKWLVWNINTGALCPQCGNNCEAHEGNHERVADMRCPPKQIGVDEAVAAKGGKPGSLKEQVDAAMAAGAEPDRKAEAEEHFDRQPGEPVSLDIAIENLRPMKGNPRGEDLGDVSGLVKSMEMHGFIGSLFVRALRPPGHDGDDTFEVWAGNRRLKAAKLAGLKVLPCEVYELSDVAAFEMNMAEQINRNDYTPLQEGKGCRHLMEISGYTPAQVAAKYGKSASWVLKRLALIDVAPEVAKALQAGKLSLTVAQALASLPSQTAQAKALESLEARPAGQRKADETAEDMVAWLRDNEGQPLRNATWKLTDAELVPEAGACAKCPHNSANERMPGLFDGSRTTPTCMRVDCFDDKRNAAWLARTTKAKSAGAKVLSLNESKKLFARGNDLGSASRYVEADQKPPKDKQGRTYEELVLDLPAEHRPVAHLAQDNAGKLRELYVADKLLEAVAKHLKLRWAKAVVEEAEERNPSTPEAKAKRQAEQEEKGLISRVRTQVFNSTLDQVAAQLAVTFNLPAARLMAARLGERALERFRVATGVKKFPKDWLEKGATLNELLALVWLDDASDELNAWDEYDERFLALAKAHGIDVEAATKAQLATAQAEAAKAATP